METKKGGYAGIVLPGLVVVALWLLLLLPESAMSNLIMALAAGLFAVGFLVFAGGADDDDETV